MENKKLTQPSTDRISSLPVNIIHDHILPSLPDKDRKVMSSVSKSWYHNITTFPYLIFDEFSFFGSCSQNNSNNTDVFLDYVTQTLQRFHSHNIQLNLQLRKFKILITFYPKVAQFLDRWLDLVLQYNVEKIKLVIEKPQETEVNIDEVRYDLPPSVFAATSIKRAWFSRCNLLKSFPSKYKKGSSCSNLKRLFLVYCGLNEINVSNIISRCPLLEKLRFVFCGGNLNRLRISNLTRLKELIICEWRGEGDHQYPIIDIDAPSIQNLSIVGGPMSTNLDYNYSLHLQNTLSRLPSLRSLRLSKIFSLTKLKLSCHTLEYLYVLGNQNLVEIEIDAPNVIFAKYWGEFPPFTFSKNNIKCPWVLDISYKGSVDPLINIDDLLVELSKFISKKMVKSLCLSFTDVDGEFSFEKLHQSVVESTYKVEHLDLNFYDMEKDCCKELLDCVLWCCHPDTLSIQLDHSVPDDDNNYMVKHICNVLNRHRKHSSSRATRSWLHHLQDIMYVLENGTQGRYLLISKGNPDAYFLPSYDKMKFIFQW